MGSNENGGLVGVYMPNEDYYKKVKDSIPSELRSYVAMNELLNSLLGIPSDHIQFNSFESGDVHIDEAFYDVPTVEYIKALLPVSIRYCKVRNFFEKHGMLQSAIKSSVLEALAASMNPSLKEYEVLCLSMETQFRQDKLTLQKMFVQLQRSTKMFHHLSDLISAIRAGKLQAAHIINLIDQLYSKYKSDEDLKVLYHHLLQESSLPIYRMICESISFGSIKDPRSDFFIQELVHRRKEDLGEDYNASYWNEKFTVQEENRLSIIPEPVEQKILLTCKYLHALRESGVFSETEAVSLSYADGEQALSKIVNAAYDKANTALLNLLLTKYDLFSRIDTLKNMFFLQYGDVFGQFLDLVKDDLQAPAGTISVDKLQSCLDFSLKNGSSSQSPYVKDIKIHFLNSSYVEQLNRIYLVAADLHVNEKPNTIKELPLTCSQALSLDSVAFFPVSLILSRNVIIKYELIFRHLFGCHLLERQLSRCLTPTELPWFRIIERKFDGLHGSFHYLRNLKSKMWNFIVQFRSYLLLEVLEYQWKAFQSKFRSLTSIDGLISAHTNFLELCLKESLMTNHRIFRVLNKIISTCRVFVVFCDKISKDLSVDIDSINGVFISKFNQSVHKNLGKFEDNFTYHLKLLKESLQFFSATDFDHRIGTFIYKIDHFLVPSIQIKA